MRLRFEGELDLETSPIASAGLKEPLSGQQLTVILDLSRLAFMDSSGLSLILATMKDIEGRDGRFVISRPSSAVERVFDATGLAALFERMDDLPADPVPCPVCDDPLSSLARRCASCGSAIGGVQAN